MGGITSIWLIRQQLAVRFVGLLKKCKQRRLSFVDHPILYATRQTSGLTWQIHTTRTIERFKVTGELGGKNLA